MGHKDKVIIETHDLSSDDIIVWKFNINTIDVARCAAIVSEIKKECPNNYVVAIPDDSCIEIMDKNNLIQFCNKTIKLLEWNK